VVTDDAQVLRQSQSVQPSDGDFDEALEPFEIDIEPDLEPGSHALRFCAAPSSVSTADEYLLDSYVLQIGP